jgi:hypothetical protein
MDEQTQILLNSYKNINSIVVDEYQKIELVNKSSQIIEYDIRNALSATEIFDAEREANPIYRIYGRIEYLSLLNGLSLNYTGLSSFFLSQKTNIKTLLNSFEFYLLKPSTNYTKITTSNLNYIRGFEVIATPNDFEIYNAGYSNNVYGEQIYSFNFNKDFDISTYQDYFGFPATELFLYVKYVPKTNGVFPPQPETMSATTWNMSGITSKTPIYYEAFSAGTSIYGDLIEYSKPQFFQEQRSPQIYYISTPYKDGLTTKYLQWKYNPFISLRLRYFADNLSRANTGSTSYEQQSTIPYYATSLGNGNYIWKEIISQGQIDPLTGLGVDYPFINKKRYLFASIVLDVMPDLSDPNSNTFKVFSEIKFGAPIVFNKKPLGDVSNIGKPCL